MNHELPGFPGYVRQPDGSYVKPKVGAARVHAIDPKPVEGRALERVDAGEEARWYGPARRFEITFTVYACAPCDWDGWDVKRLQDWIVTAGIIPDDGWKTLSGRVLSQKVRQKSEERTEISITPIYDQPPTPQC